MTAANHDHILDQIAMEGLAKLQKKIFFLLSFSPGIPATQIGQFLNDLY